MESFISEVAPANKGNSFISAQSSEKRNIPESAFSFQYSESEQAIEEIVNPNLEEIVSFYKEELESTFFGSMSGL
jgi:cell division ATPase FtsA